MSQPPPYPPPPGHGWPPAPPPPKQRNVNAIILGTAAALIVTVIGAGVIVTQAKDDDAESGNRAACKTEMAERYRTGVEDHLAGQTAQPDEDPPAACLFLGRVELTQILGEVVEEYMGSPEADAAFEDAMREAMESAFPTSTP